VPRQSANSQASVLWRRGDRTLTLACVNELTVATRRRDERREENARPGQVPPSCLNRCRISSLLRFVPPPETRATRRAGVRRV
jgi:hypothetical protein